MLLKYWEYLHYSGVPFWPESVSAVKKDLQCEGFDSLTKQGQKKSHTKKEIVILPISHKPNEIKWLVKSHPKVGGRDGAESFFLESNSEF